MPGAALDYYYMRMAPLLGGGYKPPPTQQMQGPEFPSKPMDPTTGEILPDKAQEDAGQGAKQDLPAQSDDCGTGNCNKKPDDDKAAKDEKEKHRRELGTDPETGKFSQMEADNGGRIEQYLGQQLTRSQAVGADFVGPDGTTYDAMGPVPSQYFNEQQFTNSIDAHLLKSNDFTSIDLTGLTPQQQQGVTNYINNTLTPRQQSSIILLGK